MESKGKERKREARKGIYMGRILKERRGNRGNKIENKKSNGKEGKGELRFFGRVLKVQRRDRVAKK